MVTLLVISLGALFAIACICFIPLLLVPLPCVKCETDKATGRDGLCDICRIIKKTMEEEARSAL